MPLILELINGLAVYEKLAHEVTATEAGLRETLFGARPAAEVIIAYAGDMPAGFALFFPNFSTFLGKPGLYLEDLFVVPEWRGHGLGLALMKRWPPSRWSAAAAASSGRCSTGTSRRLVFTRASARA